MGWRRWQEARLVQGPRKEAPPSERGAVFDQPTELTPPALPQRPDVVVTDGAAPVRWCLSSETGEQDAFKPAQVVDTTGAGDAFTAGLLHRWDAAPMQRIRFAAACGALVCGGAGGIDPQPTQGQVEAFLGSVS